MIKRMNVYRVKLLGRNDPLSYPDFQEAKVLAHNLEEALDIARVLYIVIRLDAVEMVLENVAVKEQE